MRNVVAIRMDLEVITHVQRLFPNASAIVHLGSLKAKTSDEQYCMLHSGANVSVVLWKPGMKGEKTVCTLVGDNKTEGLIISRLYTHSRVHLIVAVKEALVLLPISYVIRIGNVFLIRTNS